MFDLVVYCSVVLLFIIAVYYKRNAIMERIPDSIRNRLPGSRKDYTLLPTTFEDQAAHGYSSSAFDLAGNVSGDSRVGLDERQLQEIRDIMKRERVKSVNNILLIAALGTPLTTTPIACSFDQARLIRHKREMARNGIDPLTGLPTDPRAVTRL
ncbi:hypothetical protein M408DRAFT_186551 [Serendipita vermifera MAFF 305830]|uniref:Uncharacterized protein n=1 Tax=Serendipita vermifera MAFF 305830 TaxID=933852 RepID=A0A0C3BL48_SERVB|nr:hypothetical protein M408DRAFT_186551 [Serendipita vermifera MAFF 305830]